MLYYFVATIYVLVCFLLLIVVLLQQGKGGDMASAFGGGGSQTAFGARQGATVLSKATAVLGGLFMLGAIALAYLGNTSGSLLGGFDAPARPTAPASVPAAPRGSAPPATPVAPAPSPATPTPVEKPKPQ
jgi:preprotein translocase subunit SecG